MDEEKNALPSEMGIHHLLKDERFNIFFSFIVGLGIMCIIRPRCEGAACNVSKAPEDKDFEKHVYRMGGGKCYEFKTEMTECPASGAIESFVNGNNKHSNKQVSPFATRGTPIRR